MRAGQLSLLLALTLLVGACAKEDSTGARSAGATPDATSAAGLGSAPGAHDKAKTADSAQPATITRLNEDGSETVEETTGDSGAQNPLLAAVASTVAAATPAASAAAGSAAQWQEGVNYTRLVPAQPTEVPPGQVEVLEFFWYACPHCFDLETTVAAWNKTKPAYITFTRVPVMWNAGHRSLARLFYTLQSMGKLTQVHDEIFKEIQVNGDPLIGGDPENLAAAERVQVAFIRKLGLSEVEFEKAYHSFDVDKDMSRADVLVQRYRVTAVPTFVVNGKYIADVATASAPLPTIKPERLMALINDLAAQEHKH